MRLLALIGALVILAAIGTAAFLFGGFYDVAASAPRGGAVDWALEHIREASIARRATATPPATLDDVAAIQAGASNFAKLGCQTCHGGIGVDRDRFAKGAMNPGPPGLRTIAKDEPAEIFWIVKNGIRMTAMPSFGKIGVSDDDIWQIVAFAKKSTTISSADYKAWTAPPAPPAPAPAPPPAASPPAAANPPPVQEAAPAAPPPAQEAAPPPAQEPAPAAPAPAAPSGTNQ